MKDFDLGDTELQPFAGKNLPPSRIPAQSLAKGHPESRRDMMSTHMSARYSGHGNRQDYPPKNSKYTNGLLIIVNLV